MPEELFFFLASLTYILDLPDLPWVFIHDYLLSFNININISILSFLFILYLVSLLFVHSSQLSSRCKVPLYFDSLPIYRDGIYPKNTPLIPIRPSTVWITPSVGKLSPIRHRQLDSLSLSELKISLVKTYHSDQLTHHSIRVMPSVPTIERTNPSRESQQASKYKYKHKHKQSNFK
jgi:hypothetical protein